MIKGLFFLKVVEVFIADLRSDCRLVRSLNVSDIFPVKVFEKSMSFDLFNSISAEALVGIGY